MLKLFRVALLALACIGVNAHADILWVGDSPACASGVDTYTTIVSALGGALRSGDDEIRLTNTITYSGASNRLGLDGWNASGPGALTISGGYSDCFSSQSGRTQIGDAVGPLVRIGNSDVTLRNLVIAGGTSLRGLDVSGASEVFVINTLIQDNIAGVIVSGGAIVDIDAASRIQSNFSPGLVQFGGGLRCSGSNTLVSIRGRLISNYGNNGGNLYVGNGCFVELIQGAQVNDGSALFGGGAYVDGGGGLLASGGASRVVFDDNFVDGDGGGLYIRNSGQATLINTLLRNNAATREGSAVYAANGGTTGSPQLVMDRAQSCPFLISCSELEQNQGPLSVVFASNSNIRIQRTLFDQNLFRFSSDVVASGLIYLADSSAFINRVGFIGNEAYAPISTFGAYAVIRHVTAIDNTFLDDPGLDSFAMSVRGLSGDIDVYNSIFADTRGIDGPPSGGFTSICNLVDDPFNWPSGSVFQDTAQFINVAGGDLRQLPSSPGVDMCNAQPGAPVNDRDLEFQLAPVNEFFNQQGAPGQSGGLWDAGVDEVYSTIGDDEFTLTVTRNGSGTGFVNSSPPGISCGSDCSNDYFQGTLVTLAAVPSSGSTFAGWIGCPLPNGSQCFNTVDADRTITATFDRDEFVLSVERAGSGSGSVVSTPLGIACGSDCEESFDEGTLVTLFANASTGSEFAGWDNCPMADGNVCLYSVTADRTITATFTSTTEFTLTVERSGSGAGIVNSTPAGINCGADCSEAFVEDTLVTLVATASGGSSFAGWVGCPLTNGNQCFNTVDSNRTITAVFDQEEFALTIVKSGTGDGLVTSTPAGINCGPDCSASYPPGSAVILIATGDADSVFLRWTNCPSPGGNQCQTTTNANRTITARFEDEDVIFADQFED